MSNAFKGGDSTGAMTRAEHDAGIELNDTGGIGAAGQADGMVIRVGLDNANALFNSIEQWGAPIQQVERYVIGRLAKRPGGNDEGRVTVSGWLILGEGRGKHGAAA